MKWLVYLVQDALKCRLADVLDNALALELPAEELLEFPDVQHELCSEEAPLCSKAQGQGVLRFWATGRTAAELRAGAPEQDMNDCRRYPVVAVRM